MEKSYEYLKIGNEYFSKELFNEAFKYFHKAHMMSNFDATFMLGECYRISYQQQLINQNESNESMDYMYYAFKIYCTVLEFKPTRIDAVGRLVYILHNLDFDYCDKIFNIDIINQLNRLV